jgi:5'-nucleotidase
MEWKLILFDLDDTLFDFQTNWEQSMKQTIQTHPATSHLPCDDLCSIMKSVGDSLWPLYAKGEITMKDYRRRRFSGSMESFSCTVDEAVTDHFQLSFMKRSLDNIKPNAQINALLSALHSHIPMGIVTNGPSDQQHHKLTQLGIAHLFPADTVFISEEIGSAKPERLIFDKARSRFGVSAEETLFVGDSWSADVVGSIEAGMQAIWLNPAGLPIPVGSIHQPFAIIKKLEELRAIFQRFR